MNFRQDVSMQMHLVSVFIAPGWAVTLALHCIFISWHHPPGTSRGGLLWIAGLPVASFGVAMLARLRSRYELPLPTLVLVLAAVGTSWSVPAWSHTSDFDEFLVPMSSSSEQLCCAVIEDFRYSLVAATLSSGPTSLESVSKRPWACFFVHHHLTKRNAPATMMPQINAMRTSSPAPRLSAGAAATGASGAAGATATVAGATAATGATVTAGATLAAGPTVTAGATVAAGPTVAAGATVAAVAGPNVATAG